MANQTLNVPPFPSLQWDAAWTWTGKVVLRSWSGFRSPRRPWWSFGACASSDGMAELTVWSEVWARPGTPPERSNPTPPMPEQARAFQYLLQHEDAIRDAILRAVLSEYQDTRASHVYGLDDDEAEELMPEIDSIDQLHPLIGEPHIHVLAVANDGVAYIGFDLGCTWDEEHGVGVMTHGDRVVHVGDGATASLEWVAEEDADRKGDVE